MWKRAIKGLDYQRHLHGLKTILPGLITIKAQRGIPSGNAKIDLACGRALIFTAGTEMENKKVQINKIFSTNCVLSADIGWPTGNGKKLSCSQAQLGQTTCLAVALFLSISSGPS